MRQIVIHLKGPLSEPIVGAEIAVVAPDGTVNGAVSDELGEAIVPIVHLNESVIMVAVDGYQGILITDDGNLQNKVFTLETALPGGSTIIHGTSPIPGIIGQFNPILDSLERTYIYNNDVSFNGGEAPPFHFSIGIPFKVSDNFAHDYEITVVQIIGTISLLNYRQIS